MNLSFEYKVALVNGAGMGMGLADINENANSSAAEELASAGTKALAIRSIDDHSDGCCIQQRAYIIPCYRIVRRRTQCEPSSRFPRVVPGTLHGVAVLLDELK